MSDAELLEQCKIGLQLPPEGTSFDGVLSQKLLAVKSYMLGAGTSQTMLEDDLAVGTIVMGVTDLWNLNGGDIKFSPTFHTLVSQLAYRSSE